MFVSPDQKKDQQIVLIKDKIRSCIFFCCIKPTIFLNVLSDFNKMAEKRKLSVDKKKIRKFFRPKVFVLNVSRKLNMINAFFIKK